LKKKQEKLKIRSHSFENPSSENTKFFLKNSFKFFDLLRKSNVQISSYRSQLNELNHENMRLCNLNEEKQRQINFLHNKMMNYEKNEEKHVEIKELNENINLLENELERKEVEIEDWKQKYESFFIEANSRMELLIKHYDLSRRKYEKEVENQYENERKNDLVFLMIFIFLNARHLEIYKLD
jgi:predicted RNase H-like nuclease (RuvC/YqgF family)